MPSDSLKIQTEFLVSKGSGAEREKTGTNPDRSFRICGKSVKRSTNLPIPAGQHFSKSPVCETAQAVSGPPISRHRGNSSRQEEHSLQAARREYGRKETGEER